MELQGQAKAMNTISHVMRRRLLRKTQQKLDDSARFNVNFGPKEILNLEPEPTYRRCEACGFVTHIRDDLDCRRCGEKLKFLWDRKSKPMRLQAELKIVT